MHLKIFTNSVKVHHMILNMENARIPFLDRVR